MNRAIKIAGWLVLGLSCNKGLTSELELGAGVFVSSLPDYIGSDEQSSYTLPFPYIYYKNDSVEVDGNAFIGSLWQQNNWYLELSANGSIPVRSDDNKARIGMKNIDFVGEIGPAVSYYVKGSPNSAEQLSFSVTYRQAYSTDFTYLDSVGHSYGTSLHYQLKLTSFYHGELAFNASIKVDFANSDYLNFYYGIDESDVLPARPYYQANSGYRGTNINWGLAWKSDKVWLGSFIKYYNLANSTQQHSPLVNKEHNWSIGIGLVGLFYRNSK